MQAAQEMLPEPLPPPPRRARLARGSGAHELAITVRTIEASATWSRVVPVSAMTGLPLLARDRRPPEPGLSAAERVGAVAIALLSVATAVLAIVLVA